MVMVILSFIYFWLHERCLLFSGVVLLSSLGLILTIQVISECSENGDNKNLHGQEHQDADYPEKVQSHMKYRIALVKIGVAELGVEFALSTQLRR